MISEELHTKIMEQHNMTVLKQWSKIAAESKTMDECLSKI